jgi:drug/metabolite transporter (DMT)-like permease
VTQMPVVVASLLATLFFSLSTALKHRSATTLAHSGSERGAARLGQFVVATLSHRWWIAGLLADAGGLALQAFALHVGEVSVVQPLLVTALLFSLIISHRVAGTRMTPAELRWGAVLVVALVGFLVISGAATNHSPHAEADRWPAFFSGVGAAAVALVCLAVARRLPHGRRAAMIGVAVGTVYACTAVLIKAVTNIMTSHGLVALLTSWQLPVLVVAGAGGILLAQLAFRSGPLTASLPAMASLDPLLSVALGIIVYDEHLRTGAGAVTGEILSLAALAAAAIALSRVPAPVGGPHVETSEP